MSPYIQAAQIFNARNCTDDQPFSYAKDGTHPCCADYFRHKQMGLAGSYYDHCRSATHILSVHSIPRTDHAIGLIYVLGSLLNTFSAEELERAESAIRVALLIEPGLPSHWASKIVRASNASHAQTAGGLV